METNCQFQAIQCVRSLWPRVRCVNCGQLAAEPIDQSCPRPGIKQPATMPTLPERIWNYLTGAALRAVRPATPEQILDRFTKCSACTYYNDAEEACCVCGCYANLLTIGEGLNKLADKNEACPLEGDQKQWDKIS